MHLTYPAVKALQSGGERIIEGWATTSREDLVGDVVVPEGCKYTLPLPLLFNHDHGQPIGAVLSATVTRAGIRVRAKLTEGIAKGEEVWRLLLDGALNAVSIGFKALDATRLPNGGQRFDSWTLLELSVVAVPCNPDARISIGKSMAYTDARTYPQPSQAGKINHGYVKDMSVGGIDLERIFENNLERAKQLYCDAAKSKDTMPHFAYLIAEFAKANSRQALALIKDLEERLARIEDRGIGYRGNYNQSDSYKAGDLVTHQGSIFHATRDTTGLSPAHGDERKQLDHPWQLACRRGRDAAQR